MSDKEFLNLETEVKNLITISKQLKESNLNLLKKNEELSAKQKLQAQVLETSSKKIEELLRRLKKS
ncbi:MAG: hypothetical protein CMD85_01895 [Gammaproteobacteria bacterium]|nr:hypothetical protein [Gammaproteobacteria bacterium]|tara:strand:- start:1256 stop:1453 length:198 start_codon:yes stop_codon:yes gene_type:complete